MASTWNMADAAALLDHLGVETRMSPATPGRRSRRSWLGMPPGVSLMLLSTSARAGLSSIIDTAARCLSHAPAEIL
jgi:hypothetical protein